MHTEFTNCFTDQTIEVIYRSIIMTLSSELKNKQNIEDINYDADEDQLKDDITKDKD